MLIWENIRLAFAALAANKLRAFLTMLGIIIGIGSVIAILTVSASLSNSISAGFQEMGANNITAGLAQKSEEEEVRSNGMRFGAGYGDASIEKEDRITEEMLQRLEENFPEEIKAIALSESVGSCTAERGGESANLSVMGINPEYYQSSQVKLLAGRYIKQKDLDGEKKVIMVSDRAVENLFDGDSDAALWQKISVERNGSYTDYYIVGVYSYESEGSLSGSSSQDLTTAAYIPLTTAREQQHTEDGYTQFTIVTALEVGEVSDFADRVESFFVPYYMDNADYEVATSTMESMTESMDDMIGTVSMAVSLIAGISLLVGGIGVMNIMLVSITERTREIGTRKALGATNGSIRLQFIVEAVVLCLIGGCLGVLCGLGAGTAAASALGYPAAAPVAASLAAVGFSMAVGVFFGFYPANKAAGMNPIDALRYE